MNRYHVWHCMRSVLITYTEYISDATALGSQDCLLLTAYSYSCGDLWACAVE